MDQRIYLASPYTADLMEVREGRYRAARSAAAALLRRGLPVCLVDPLTRSVEPFKEVSHD